jgi:hypothetical protein
MAELPTRTREAIAGTLSSSTQPVEVGITRNAHTEASRALATLTRFRNMSHTRRLIVAGDEHFPNRTDAATPVPPSMPTRSKMNSSYGGVIPRWEGSIPSPRRAVAVSSEPAIGRADVRSCYGERALTELSSAKAGGRVRARFWEDAVALEMPVPAAARDFLGRSLWAVGAPPRTAGSRLYGSRQASDRFARPAGASWVGVA